MSNALLQTLAEENPAKWTTEEITRQLETFGIFNSKHGKTINTKPEESCQLKTKEIAPELEEELARPKISTNQPQPYFNHHRSNYSPSDVQNWVDKLPEHREKGKFLPGQDERERINAKSLVDLMKLYHNDNEKYGCADDILNKKLLRFYERCEILQISKSDYHKVFHVILKGRASDFYFDSISGRGFDFEKNDPNGQRALRNRAVTSRIYDNVEIYNATQYNC